MSTFKVGDRVRLIPKNKWNLNWMGYSSAIHPNLTGVVVKISPDSISEEKKIFNLGVDFSESLSSYSRDRGVWPYHSMNSVLPEPTGRWLSERFFKKIPLYDKTWV